ncbi:MAG: single-stranded DNA-binding protein [Candidatus Zixiibacteriota bacterium]|nr:MAG: single-stranded DNA-binding protein [candidate division Zixibacteria bacterium]
MASVNKAILIGNLGADPELRYTASGTAVAGFNMATTERYKDKNGELQERTEWHSIVCWGRLGELANEYLRKGRSVYIEGRIQTRNYEDKDGIKRYRTEIVAQQMQFLGGRAQGDQPSAPSETASPAPSESELPADDDDLPF